MRLTSIACSLLLSCLSCLSATYGLSTIKPPVPAREFRGVWVASVANIDWPSKPGLPVAQQKAELLAILDAAARLNLNAVILQVRPGCDALYHSTLEPWSEYLTGQMGQAPEPLYDPLAFAVTEAHARGLELHAWVNPYRARHPSAKSEPSANHISKTQPHLVKTYGRHLWLDPGEKAVQEYSLRVILDIVRRYEVDGVHMDDYFYPYKEKDADGKIIEFPDEPSWQRYVAGGGKLNRADWRRSNVNQLIERAYRGIKQAKPWVKFGVSPFGIWRSGHPPSIKGYDPYENLFADSRHWLVKGWLDYFTPQLYWAIDQKEQSYSTLLKWWGEQNPKARHIWPGNNTRKVSSVWQPEEILQQIQFTRKQKHATGNIHWSIRPLVENRNGISEALRQGPYAQKALVPACAWLGKGAPAKPKVYAGGNPSAGLVIITWAATGKTDLSRWVIQAKQGDHWTLEVLPASRTSYSFSAPPDAMAVSAMDRYGRISPATVLAKGK